MLGRVGAPCHEYRSTLHLASRGFLPLRVSRAARCECGQHSEQIPQGLIRVERRMPQDLSRHWALPGPLQPMLNCRALVGVAICTDNRVPHYIVRNRAEERIEAVVVVDPRAPELFLRPEVKFYAGSATGGYRCRRIQWR